MPIYEYQCHACGHRLETLQKVSARPLTDCPACEEPALRKLVSAVAFRFKGGGWYETDFKDEKSRRNLAREDDRTGTADGAGTTPGENQGKEAKTDNGGATGKETKSVGKPPGTGAGASAPAS